MFTFRYDSTLLGDTFFTPNVFLHEKTLHSTKHKHTLQKIHGSKVKPRINRTSQYKLDYYEEGLYVSMLKTTYIAMDTILFLNLKLLYSLVP